MASVRVLKKQLKHQFNELKNECLIYLIIHPDVETQAITGLIKDLDELSKGLFFHLNHARYKPAGHTAKQYINQGFGEAREKLDSMVALLKEKHP
jgi:hypothetical protein